MLRILSKKLNAALFTYAYSKYSFFTTNTPLESAILRFKKEKAPKPQLASLKDAKLKDYIKELNTWNDSLTHPVKVEDDFTQYTALDWVALEKKILMAQLKECTHSFNPDGFVDMKKKLDTRCPFFFRGSFLLWYPSMIATASAMGESVLQYNLFISSLFKDINSHAASSALMLGIFLALGVLVGGAWFFATLFDSATLRNIIAERLSSNWDKVIEEHSLADAMLVSMLIHYYKETSAAKQPIIDVRTLSPDKAFCILVDSLKHKIPTSEFQATMPIAQETYDSFKADIFQLPIVPTCNMQPLIELTQASQELTLNIASQQRTLLNGGHQ